LKSLQKLDSKLIGEIEHFFVSYNDVRGSPQGTSRGETPDQKLDQEAKVRRLRL